MTERIKSLRESLGMSQTEFAEKINLTKNYMSLVENGKRNLSDRSIADLVKVYGVNEEWLRTGVGEMFLEKTYEDEVAYFLSEVVHADPDDPRVELMHILAKLPPECWKMVSDFIDVIKSEPQK